MERFSVKSLCGRLPRLQSTKSVGVRIPEREVLAPFFGLNFFYLVHFSVHFLHHTRELEKEDPAESYGSRALSTGHK